MLRVLSVIFLVIIFRRPKLHRRQNFGHNRLFKFSSACELRFRSLGNFLFLGVAIKDRGTITGADVGELAVGLGGIDLSPIDVEKRLVRNFFWIVSDFD